jgi:hypothetical protein
VLTASKHLLVSNLLSIFLFSPPPTSPRTLYYCDHFYFSGNVPESQRRCSCMPISKASSPKKRKSSPSITSALLPSTTTTRATTTIKKENVSFPPVKTTKRTTHDRSSPTGIPKCQGKGMITKPLLVVANPVFLMSSVFVERLLGTKRRTQRPEPMHSQLSYYCGSY